MTITQLVRDARRVTICFCKLRRRCYGLYEFVEGSKNNRDALIFIDLQKNANPARVFLHELLHRAYPKETSEHAIMTRERRMWQRASQYERYFLYRTLFLRKWRHKIF